MQYNTESTGSINLQTLPGYQVYEYQLVLVLPDSLREKIRKLKIQFSEEFGTAATGMSVMLPLVRFKQRQLLEQKIRFSLQQLLYGWRPFAVNLKDFAAHPTHTICIPVTSRHRLQDCITGLKGLQNYFRMSREQSAFFSSEFSLTLASRLSPGVFDKAWKQFSHRHFTAQFQADAALLLKRRPGESHWQIAQRFEFRDLPVGAVQTKLFAV